MATLESQSVLIFGGSSGIGYAVAEASLKTRAALVIIASSNATRVADAVKRLESTSMGSGKIRGEVVDAADFGAVKDLLARIGEIDHLVFTSGSPLKKLLEQDDIDAWKSMFDVRFWGAVVAAKSAKIRPGGSITLTVGSILVKPMKGWSIGAGIAGAIDSTTRGLAVDLAPIRVNVISPGSVQTLAGLWNDLPKSQRTTMGEKLLVKHVAVPAEVAEAYLFVMKCTFITGQRIEVDGGLVLGA